MRSRHYLSIAFAVLAGFAVPGTALHGLEFRVGPGGEYATLHEAALIAGTTPGEHTIKVRAGTYPAESGITVPSGVEVTIVGGWDAAFSSRTDEPAATIFDGGAAVEVASFVGSGRLTLEGMTFRNGTRGLEVRMRSAEGFGRIARCVVHANVAESPDFSLIGVGASVYATDGARVEIVDSVFSSNRATTPVAVTQGAGLQVALFGAQASILRNRFVANESTALWTQGAGMDLSVQGSGSRVEVADNEFVDNLVQSLDPSDGLFDSSGLGVAIHGTGNRVELRRNRFTANLGAPQLILRNPAGSLLSVSDSLLADGLGSPAALECQACEGETQLTNLTIAGSGGIRIGPYPSRPIAISNTIVLAPGAAILTDPGLASPVLSANLVGVDPHFVDAAGGDYRLRPGSPGIDAGDDTPPRGLGPLDLEGDPRVAGAHVDIGAFERSRGENCLVGGRFFPVPSHTNACTCVRDEGLRFNRCGFFLPEIFLEAIFPIPTDPVDPTDPQWVILPWQGADGPYGFAFEVFRDGKWASVSGNGPGTGTLKLDTLTTEKFKLPAGDRELPLRARLKHVAPGLQGPLTVEDVVYLYLGK